MQNKELTVQTPLGELAVGINADPDYPGISVAFRGDGMNDCFNAGSIWLAWIEYSPEKHCLQAVIYGDGNADDYTHLIEFKNILEQDKPSASPPSTGKCKPPTVYHSALAQVGAFIAAKLCASVNTEQEKPPTGGFFILQSLKLRRLKKDRRMIASA